MWPLEGVPCSNEWPHSHAHTASTNGIQWVIKNREKHEIGRSHFGAIFGKVRREIKVDMNVFHCTQYEILKYKKINKLIINNSINCSQQNNYLSVLSLASRTIPHHPQACCLSLELSGISQMCLIWGNRRTRLAAQLSHLWSSVSP